MIVKNIGSNMIEVILGELRILVSYETPVAAHTMFGFIKTSKKWSKTTSQHINKWLDGAVAEERPQKHFHDLLNYRR